MLRKVEITALIITDFLFLSLGMLFYYMARFRWGWVATGPEPPNPFVAMLFVTSVWMILFLFAGLYREQFAPSRFDEVTLLIKIVTVGSLGFFFIFFSEALTAGSARPNLLLFWGSVLGFVATGRMLFRTLQIALLERGYGTRKALILGWNERVQSLYEEVTQYPSTGLKFVGAIQMADEALVPVPAGVEVRADGNGTQGVLLEEAPEIGTASLDDFSTDELRSVQHLPRIVDRLEVQDILLVLGPEDHHYLNEILRVCDGRPVTLKLVPNYYDILNGMARTEQIYGLPVIEALPEPMRHWERNTKRLIDLVVSMLVLVMLAPLWVLLGIMVRLSSPGPAIFRQERVGKQGKTFMMYKYRTMRQDAEVESGPVWASEDDPRYTALGRWLRKTRLDEIPQLWNVVKNEMSLVGPRPERPFFVEKLVKEIPLYRRRLRVKPGITGLAQVKWKYDESIEDVRQKVKYDLTYISNMSLRMDFKLLFATLRTALLGKGQ